MSSFNKINIRSQTDIRHEIKHYNSEIVQSEWWDRRNTRNRVQILIPALLKSRRGRVALMEGEDSASKRCDCYIFYFIVTIVEQPCSLHHGVSISLQSSQKQIKFGKVMLL